MNSNDNGSSDSKDPLYDKLKEDIDESDWSLLEDHHKRKALFILHEEIDIIRVGIAMAKDDVEIIRDLMAKQQLSQPTEEEVETWQKDLHQRFQFLIIQPYVIIKLMKRDS